MSSKIWRAIEQLRVFSVLYPYEEHEKKIIVNLFDTFCSEPYKANEELSQKQKNLVEAMYKKYIWIDF